MLSCCLYRSPVGLAGVKDPGPPHVESPTERKLRGMRVRRDPPRALDLPDLALGDLFAPDLEVRIPEIETARLPPPRSSSQMSMMEQIAKMPRPKTNCALAVIYDPSRPPRAYPHPHEKTGYLLGQKIEGLPPSTYRGSYQGWQQNYGSLKVNVAYEPLAERNRLPVRLSTLSYV